MAMKLSGRHEALIACLDKLPDDRLVMMLEYVGNGGRIMGGRMASTEYWTRSGVP